MLIWGPGGRTGDLAEHDLGEAQPGLVHAFARVVRETSDHPDH